jgi:hypothetical protein
MFSAAIQSYTKSARANHRRHAVLLGTLKGKTVKQMARSISRARVAQIKGEPEFSTNLLQISRVYNKELSQPPGKYFDTMSELMNNPDPKIQLAAIDRFFNLLKLIYKR